MNFSFHDVYKGVDFRIPGTGGDDCLQYLTSRQKLIETSSVTVGCLVLLIVGFKYASLPKYSSTSHTCTKQFLLAVHCLTFGVELGFKLASQTLIWIMNPCHVTTILQIILLVARPSRLSTALFRIHLYLLHGAVIALLLPVVNTRLLPGETMVYYVQHVMMIAVPIYLFCLGGCYQAESVMDWSWLMISYSLTLLYHFLPMQAVTLFTRVNVGQVLCPAISDPFRGPYYRLWSVAHTFAAMLLFGKGFAWLCMRFLRPTPKAVSIDHTAKNGAGKLITKIE